MQVARPDEASPEREPAVWRALVPAAAWLFASALGLLGVARRRAFT